MNSQTPINQDQYVDVEVAANVLGVSKHYLNRLRIKGGGPVYSNFGRAVRYRVGGLLAWAKEREVANTSAPPPKRTSVLPREAWMDRRKASGLS